MMYEHFLGVLFEKLFPAKDAKDTLSPQSRTPSLAYLAKSKIHDSKPLQPSREILGHLKNCQLQLLNTNIIKCVTLCHLKNC